MRADRYEGWEKSNENRDVQNPEPNMEKSIY